MIVREALSDPSVRIVGAVASSQSAHLGADLGSLCGMAPLGVHIVADPDAVLAGAEVVIDFSTPAGTLAIASRAAAHGTALVVGTTGLDGEAERALAQAATRVPVVRSANMSLGVNVLLDLIWRASCALPDFDVEVVEMHHRMKQDAPSGTALLMARVAAEARGTAIGDALRSARSGQVGPRRREEVGVMAIRGGDVVGEHTVFFLGWGERVEITHRAGDRSIFARGALRAARWVQGRAAGCYDMRDVLGLNQQS